MLKPDRDVGIVGYGAYVPRYRLPAAEVARVWTGGAGGLPIKEKAVAGLDEDTLTMSIEAARNALARARIDPQELRAVWVGSESHPYAVKPTSTIVAEAIGATPYVQARKVLRCTRRCSRTSPTRRTSGGEPTRTIPATVTASRASRRISNISPARRGS
jgi:3-oxoacyl-[acyl-carrier-protein] synthase III